jgi:hypothetical protein
VNSTTVTKKGDVPYWKNGKLPQVFAFQTDIVLIKLGTNDTKPQNWEALGYGAQFKTDYLAMIDTLAAMASHPKIFLVIPVPVFAHPTGASWGIRDSVIQKEIPIIKEIAAARGLALIDANTPLKKFPQYFSADGVHPDAAGEDTIAHIVYRALIATSVSTPALQPGISVAMKGNDDIVGLSHGTDSPIIESFDIAGKLLYRCAVSGNVRGTLDAANLSHGVKIIYIANKYSIRFR